MKDTFQNGSLFTIQTPAMRVKSAQRLPGPKSEHPSHRQEASRM